MLAALGRLGIDADTPPALNRSVRAVNVLSLVSIVVSAFNVPYFARFDDPWWLHLVSLGCGVLLVGPLLLNARRHYWAAATLLCAIYLFALSAWCLAFGTAAGAQYHLIMVMAGAPLLYSWSSRVSAVMVSALALASFAFFVFAGDRIEPAFRLPPDVLQATWLLSNGIVAVSVALVALHTQRETTRTEAELEKRSVELASALAELTETQALMVEAESHALVGRLAAGVAHEINTPLGAVRSGSDTLGLMLERCGTVLSEENADPKDRERLLRTLARSGKLRETVSDGSKRIGDLATALAHFASLDEAEQRDVDLRATIDDVLTLISGRLHGRVQFQRNFPNVAVLVHGDAARLSRSVLSMLEHAASGSEGVGNVQIDIAMEEDEVTLSVTDDGEGLNEAELEAALGLGFGARGGRVALRIGLPSARRCVEAMGGELTLSSESGAGSTLCATFPRAEPAGADTPG